MHLSPRAFLLSVLVPLACTVACAAPTDEEEAESSGASEDALKSAVSCEEESATGYKSGSSYSMTTITVGGKATAKSTAHAFLKMQAAADKAGVRLTIASGFRTMKEQQYFYSCYQTKKCNGGNLAARPGYSNHQNGRALDLATSNWTWVANNAPKYGFKRTVPSERWHWEFFGSDPGGPCSAGAKPTTPEPTTPDNTANPTDDEEQEQETNPSDVPVPTPKPTTGAGCFSPTLNAKTEEGACVQSAADDVVYQCHEGLWYRNVVAGKGPFGTCTSSHMQ